MNSCRRRRWVTYSKPPKPNSKCLPSLPDLCPKRTKSGVYAERHPMHICKCCLVPMAHFPAKQKKKYTRHMYPSYHFPGAPRRDKDATMACSRRPPLQVHRLHLAGPLFLAVLLLVHPPQPLLHSRILLHLLPQLEVPLLGTVAERGLLPGRPLPQPCDHQVALHRLVGELRAYQNGDDDNEGKPPQGIRPKGQCKAIAHGVRTYTGRVGSGEDGIPYPPSNNCQSEATKNDGCLVVCIKDTAIC